MLGARLAPDEMFPAGWAGHAVRWMSLASGLRVRVVTCEPSGAVSDGPTVLFVHGWACSAYTWHRNLRAAADAGMRAVAVDLKGHGLSDKPLDTPGYTLPAMGRHVVDVLDALGLDRALLVGHSMGGSIALRVAVDAPGRVAGLVLAAPVGFGAISLMRIVPWLTPPLIEQALPRVMPRWTFQLGLWRAYGRLDHATPRDVDEYFAPTRDPAFVRVLCRLARAFEWDEGEPDELATVRCPTYVLFGSRDHLVRPDACLPFAACIPNVTVETIEGAGHLLPTEAADRMNVTIAAAWRSVADAMPMG